MRIRKFKGIGDALTYILKDMEKAFDLDKSHILVTHFAVSKKEDQDGQSLRELMLSETSNTVGGLTNVTSDLFKAFDYVPWGISIPALLVRASACNIQEVQSPLMSKKPKRKEEKGVYILELDASGDLSQTFHSLEVRRPIVTLQEPFETFDVTRIFIRKILVKRLGLLLIFNCPVVRN